MSNVVLTFIPSLMRRICNSLDLDMCLQSYGRYFLSPVLDTLHKFYSGNFCRIGYVENILALWIRIHRVLPIPNRIVRGDLC